MNLYVEFGLCASLFQLTGMDNVLLKLRGWAYMFKYQHNWQRSGEAAATRVRQRLDSSLTYLYIKHLPEPSCSVIHTILDASTDFLQPSFSSQINELSHVQIPIMLMPDDFKAYSKIKVDNHLFNK